MAAVQQQISGYYKNNSANVTVIPSMYVTTEVVDNKVVPINGRINPGVKQ